MKRVKDITKAVLGIVSTLAIVIGIVWAKTGEAPEFIEDIVTVFFGVRREDIPQ